MNNIAPTVLSLSRADVIWAGGNPLGPGYCLGLEDGKVLLVDLDGTTDERIASATRDAVNCVAQSQGWLAVTTRSDVNFIPPAQSGLAAVITLEDYGGAHEVTVAPVSENFVFALGPNGVMMAKVVDNSPRPVYRAKWNGLNVYRLLTLPIENRSDLIVAAGRHGGIGYLEYEENKACHTLCTMKNKELDFVDLCSASSPTFPYAVIAAACDGTLLYFKNIRSSDAPTILRSRHVKGSVYRLLRVRKDIYLLTTLGIYTLVDLVSKLASESSGLDAGIWFQKVEAADINVVADKWLIVLRADGVVLVDTHSPKNATEFVVPMKCEEAVSGEEEKSQVLSPNTLVWETKTVETSRMSA